MGPGAARRLAAVAALLIVAAVALRPAGPTSGSGSRAGIGTASLVVAGACGALAAACAVLALRGLRTLRGLQPGEAPPRRRSVVQQVLTLSLCAALLVSPLGSILLQRLGQRADAANRPAVTEQQNQRRAGPQVERRAAPLAEAAGVGAALVLVGLVTVALLRRRDRVLPKEPDPAPELRDAIAAGVAALAEEPDGSDPRDRVIRCYAAMERVLAATGTARRAADTPGELLARAQASGRVPPGPAAGLTDLFRAARFGAGEITAAEVDAARDPLRTLQEAVPLSSTTPG